MKNHSTNHQCRALLCGISSLATLLSAMPATRADEPATSKWRASFSGNSLFNVSANFKGHPATPTLAGPNNMPGAENYDNGYVGRDISNDPDYSTYWGYTQSGQPIYSGSGIIGLNFERTTAAAGLSSPDKDASVSFGGELALRRDLAQRGNLRLGLEFGFSYNPVGIHDLAGYTTDGQRSGYTYNLPGPVDSALFPPPGYQGPYNGLGLIINPTAIPGATTVASDAVLVTGSRKVDADIFGFRLGPYLEFALSDKFHAALSVGGMAAIVQDDVRWSENLSVSTATMSGYWTGSSSASDSSSGVVGGVYAGLGLGYRLTDKLGITAGARFQSLCTYGHNFGAGEMELDFGSAVTAHVGISWNF